MLLENIECHSSSRSWDQSENTVSERKVQYQDNVLLKSSTSITAGLVNTRFLNYEKSKVFQFDFWHDPMQWSSVE